MIAQLTEYLKQIVPGEWTLARTADGKFGDFASNLAFRLAKERKMAPFEAAKNLAVEVLKNDIEKRFMKVEAASPGFVNFSLSPKAFAAEVEGILNPHLKSLPAGRQAPPRVLEGGKKINLEFVSANPTGPLTMANGRGGFLGDVLGNVLEAAGYDVTREYFINDAGVQIKKLGGSILAALGLAPKSPEHYQGEYVAEIAKNLKIQISKFKSHDEEEIGRMGAKELLARIKKSLKNVGIKHDVWFSEYKNLRQKGELEKTLAYLRERGMVYEKDGAVWLKTQIAKRKAQSAKSQSQSANRKEGPEERGDDKDRVLVKSDGEATYFLADLAYHYNKFIERKFDKAIVIWGADHHGYVGRMKAGIGAMGVKETCFEAIIVQLIRLVRDGVEVKMSKRQGEFITLDDLVKEVGRDAARFFFLSHTAGNHMDFDLALAKERSNKNPVYYAQYAAVRAQSIIKKIEKQENPATNFKNMEGGVPLRRDKKTNELEKLREESEINLLKILAQFGDMVLETAEDFEVSRLIRYALEVARAFNNFYEKERVIGEDGKTIPEKLALVVAARDILERLFGLLGIGVPKKM